MILKDKVIVVTGASRGLGRETALALAERGARLVLIARTVHLLKEVAKEIAEISGSRPKVVVADLTDETAVLNITEQIKEEYSAIDVLVNNAGIGIYKRFEDTNFLEMRKQFEVNYFAPYYCTRALLPLLKKSEEGYVLNISSLLSRVPFALTSVYSSTKAAVNTFSTGLRSDIKKYNIKVGIFLPGSIDTTFQDDKNNFTTPKPLILNSKKTAAKIVKMIQNRKKSLLMYRWILILMKIKQISGK